MRRVTGCLAVLVASAAAWLGCRDDLGFEQQFAIGSGTAAIDSAIDVAIDSGSAVDAAIDSSSVVDAAIDAGSSSDAGATSDAGAMSDAGNGSDAGEQSDGGSAEPVDAAGGTDGRRGNNSGPFDHTSFYACGGGCGSTTGAGIWLPIVLAGGFAVRKRRARQSAR